MPSGLIVARFDRTGERRIAYPSAMTMLEAGTATSANW